MNRVARYPNLLKSTLDLIPSPMDAEFDAPRRFRKVPIDRRVAAFAIDCGTAALLSAIGGDASGWLFIGVWFGLRVIVVAKNRGQSLGKWAMDIKVLDPKYRALPGLLELSKRESITGVSVLFLLIGLANVNPANPWVLATPIPLLLDCGLAFTDAEFQQSFHDRLARTVVAQTKRGYSLDLKVKNLFAQARRRMK